jgi:hypothetical protein
VLGLALAERDQRDLGKLDQIAAGADAADLAHDRVDAGVEHAGEQLDRRWRDAGAALRKDLRAHQHRGAHRRGGVGRTQA